MTQVIHTVDYVYGSYSGTTKVRCGLDDDMEVVKAKVRRQESLNFLSMASYSVKVTNTEEIEYDY